MKFFERIEHALEQRNRYDWATSLRDFESHFVSAKRKRAQGDWIRKQNAERRKEFSLLQREIYLKEEVAAYEKQSQIESLTEDKAKTLEKWKKELETFDEQLWLHKRAIYTAELNKPKGPWIRTWEASINDAVLYGEKAKLLCKANGGCCERDCGCCQQYLKTTRYKGRKGHCTMECGCCIRARGFYKPGQKYA